MKNKYTKFARKKIASLGLVLWMLVVGGAAFVLGLMTSDAWQQAPIVVQSAEVKVVEVGGGDLASSVRGAQVVAGDETGSKSNLVKANCAFVGSKNSTKFYPPTCSHAKRISPKNLRCFVSEEDAKSKGYIRSASCK